MPRAPACPGNRGRVAKDRVLARGRHVDRGAEARSPARDVAARTRHRAPSQSVQASSASRSGIGDEARAACSRAAPRARWCPRSAAARKRVPPAGQHGDPQDRGFGALREPREVAAAAREGGARTTSRPRAPAEPLHTAPSSAAMSLTRASTTPARSHATNMAPGPSPATTSSRPARAAKRQRLAETAVRAPDRGAHDAPAARATLRSMRRREPVGAGQRRRCRRPRRKSRSCAGGRRCRPCGRSAPAGRCVRARLPPALIEPEHALRP